MGNPPKKQHLHGWTTETDLRGVGYRNWPEMGELHKRALEGWATETGLRWGGGGGTETGFKWVGYIKINKKITRMDDKPGLRGVGYRSWP